MFRQYQDDQIIKMNSPKLEIKLYHTLQNASLEDLNNIARWICLCSDLNILTSKVGLLSELLSNKVTYCCCPGQLKIKKKQNLIEIKF